MDFVDSIFALSTPRGKSGVCVFRISGRACEDVYRTLTGRSHVTDRRAHLVTLKDPQNGFEIDQALVLFFRAPQSFTGEDCLELQCHGSLAVIDALQRALNSFSGVRPAEAGEFSQRALINGKLSFIQVEALGDILNAESAKQLELSVGNLGSRFQDLIFTWRYELISLMALVEVGLDFSDEGDVAFVLSHYKDVVSRLKNLKCAVSRQLDGAQFRMKVRNGFKIVLVGSPNVGKSSLLNYFADDDVAIVSDIAGTTRDVLRVVCDFSGYRVELCDTAGLHESDDTIETVGIERALREIEGADIVLHLRIFGGEQDSDDSFEFFGKYLQNQYVITIFTKADLIDSDVKQSFHIPYISVVSGEGMDVLKNHILSYLQDLEPKHQQSFVTRERQFLCLQDFGIALDQAVGFAEAQEEVLVAEQLRIAALSLESLVGRIGVEDMLDQVFSSFCIGK